MFRQRLNWDVNVFDVALWIDVDESLSHLHRIPGLAEALHERDQAAAEAA